MKKLLKMSMLFVSCLLLLATVAVAKPPTKPSAGTLKINQYFTSHMVLQRGMTVPVFGTGIAGTTVTVEFNGQAVSTVVSSAGKWKADLVAMEANDLPQSLIVRSGSSTVTLTDVLVGEVWVLSGQSNINLPLWKCIGGTDAAANAANYPGIRLYMSTLSGVGTTGVWLENNAVNASNWSGVGYFFAQALQQAYDSVPIGLLQIARNGSEIAEWTTFGGSSGRYYTGNIVPLQPMAIRGVIWYQGETESNTAAYYTMLPGLIGSWRADWGQEKLPFYIVQLALISGRDYYAVIRDAQVSAVNEANDIYMACIIDVDNVPATAIHPVDKQPAGERLALIAKNKVFGDVDLVYSGPIRDPATTYINGNTIVVGFNHVEGGFFTTGGANPTNFQIAGSDGVYYSATAAVTGPTTIEVSSSSVPIPKSVRYAWDDYPTVNLFNGYDLPASPFGLTFQ